MAEDHGMDTMEQKTIPESPHPQGPAGASADRLLAREYGEELAGRLRDLRLAMIDYAADHSLPEILNFILDQVGALVASPLGFYHFIEADQRTISLQQWSTATAASFCRAEGRGFHYDLEHAGVWADCVRLGRTIVHNDYPSLPHRRGLPAGHAEVIRELVVPVIREGRVVAILGVGNKAADYDRRDADIVGYLAEVSWEIARRKQAEDLLSLQRDIESACAALSARLLTSLDLAEISLTVLETARILTKSRIGLIGSIDPDRGRLIGHVQEDGAQAAPVATTAGQFAGLWGLVLRERRPLMTNHAARDSRSAPFPGCSAGIESFLGVPVLTGGKVLGIIALANSGNSFLDGDLILAQRLADLYGLALQRHRLEAAMIEAEARRALELERLVAERTAELNAANASLVAEIEERKRVESALRMEKETARLYLDIARVGFVALDPGGRITMANDYLCRALGYPEEELIGLSWQDFLLPDDGQPGGMRRRSLAGGQFSYRESPLRTRSGETRLFAWNDVCLRSESGALLGLLCSGEDITEAVKADKQRRKSRRQQDFFAAVLHNTPLAMVYFVVDDDRIRILDWNNSAEKIFGWSKKEVLGRNFFEFLPYGEDIARVVETCRHLKENPGAHNMVNRCNSKFGELRMIDWFNHSFTEAGTGRLYVVSLGHDITARHAYEERLRKSEEHLRTIADFTFDWEEWRAPDGSYLYVSPSCERVTGYSRQEFLHNGMLTLEITHPEDRGIVVGHLRNLADQAPCMIDFRIVTRDGKVRWISHRCQPVYGVAGEWLGRRGSNRDITDRKDAEQRLLESRNMLQLVFDGIREPLLLMETGGTVLIMNSAACAYFRIEPGEARGRRCRDLTCHGERCRDCRILDAMLQGKSTGYERQGLFDPGRVEQVSVEMIRPAGEHPAMAIVRIRDITREKQIEKDLLQADKMIALGTLVSGVAHEINNPNNFISLNISLLQEVWASLDPVLERYHREYGDFLAGGLPYGEMKAEIPNLLAGIEAGARRIQKIVKQLRDYSLPGPGLLEENLQLNEIVRQALALIDKKIARATARFSVSYGSGLPPLSGSSQKLEQVVINLVLNACQSLPDRERAVRVGTACDREGGTVSLVVEDEGCGMAESVVAQIMNPFFTTKRDIGGTGLGLAVSSRIVAEHNGRIDVKSVPGAGSTFTVRLPISTSSEKNSR